MDWLRDLGRRNDGDPFGAWDTATPLLEARRLSKVFGRGRLGRAGGHRAVDDVSLALPLEEARFVAIAGESGSGKTTIARLVLGLLRPTSGEILYRGVRLDRLTGRHARAFRREVQAIFQDPFEVYNPFYRVDHVFDLPIRMFRLAADRSAARRLVEEALEVVGLEAGQILGRYPHQLSGGQRQRVMVARAFLLRPRLIVADEPVSMVDASLRSSILEAMLRLKRDFGISFLYITHDLSTAYEVSDEIIILHRGRVVERGPVRRVIEAPQDAYTKLLIQSIPIPDPAVRWKGRLDPAEVDALLATGRD
jgi:ABC-type oligopeptide transport system ATPase subunit